MGKWFMQAPFLVYPSIKFLSKQLRKKLFLQAYFGLLLLWFIQATSLHNKQLEKKIFIYTHRGVFKKNLHGYG